MTDLERLLAYFETELTKKRTQVAGGSHYVTTSDVGMYAALVAYLRTQEAQAHATQERSREAV